MTRGNPVPQGPSENKGLRVPRAPEASPDPQVPLESTGRTASVDHQENVDPLANQATKASPGPQVLWAPSVPSESRAPLGIPDLLEPLGSPVKPDAMAKLAKKVLLDQWAQLVKLGPWVLPDFQVFQGNADCPEFRALQVSRERWDPRGPQVPRATKGPWVTPEKRVLRDPTARPDPQATGVPLGPRENGVTRVFQVLQGGTAFQDQEVFPAPLVPWANPARTVTRANQDRQERRASRVIREVKGHPDPLGLKVFAVPQVPKEPPENEGPPEVWAMLVARARTDPKVSQVPLGLQVSKGFQGPQESRARRVTSDDEVSLVPLAPRVRMAKREAKEVLVFQGPRVPTDSKVPKENQDKQVPQDQLERMANTDAKVPLDLKAKKANPAPRAPQASAESWDPRAPRATQVHLGSLGPWANQESRGPRASLERTETTGRSANRDPLAKRVFQDKWDWRESTESRVPRVQPDNKVHQVSQAKRETPETWGPQGLRVLQGPRVFQDPKGCRVSEDLLVLLATSVFLVRTAFLGKQDNPVFLE